MLERGAKLAMEDKQGFKPGDLARHHGNKLVENILCNQLQQNSSKLTFRFGR